MTKQQPKDALKSIENENASAFKMEKGKQIKRGHERRASIDTNFNKIIYYP